MQPAANPGSPAPRINRPAILAITLAVVASFTSACSSPSVEAPGWQQLTPAESVETTPPNASTDSLGDPFVLIADSAQCSQRLTDTAGQVAPPALVRSAWAMLSSDACQVKLSALHVEYQLGADGPSGWLTTVESTPGVVLEASPHHAVVRYETSVRMDRDAGWSSESQVPTTIDIDVTQDGEQVWVATSLEAESPDRGTPLRLDFVVSGAFDKNPEVIPDRSFACPF